MRHLMRLLLLALLIGGLILPAAAQEPTATTTVTMIHMTDYHSHSTPFYAEGEQNMAGIARVIAYLKPYASDPNTLIFNGGDTMNIGAPPWSDKYRCVEWPWWNGILDAMAFGNHDADYGPEVFAQCKASVSYPIIGSNVLDGGGSPIFQPNGKTYLVYEINGVKIGVFSVAGPDFPRLLKPETMPVPNTTIGDRATTARQVVQQLREQEQVSAVVLIGHALYEDDVALAQAVPGIDLIFGTHSHRQEELKKIEGTNTWIISPFQYLMYLSQVQLSFTDGRLTGVSGGLVRMGSDRPEDPQIAAQVQQLQRDLEADPAYAPLYKQIGSAAVELSTSGQFTQDAVLGNFVTDILRQKSGAQMLLITSSSFREPVAPGVIREVDLRAAIPYKNTVLTYQMTGAQIQQLLDYSVSRTGSDFFSQVSGVRFNIVDGKATNIQLLRDGANPSAGYAPLDPGATYTVGTVDFQAKVAGGYKEIFATATGERNTGLIMLDEVRSYIQASSPVSARRDGRITLGAPGPLPPTGVEPAPAPQPGAAPLPRELPNTAAPGSPAAPLLVLLAIGLALLGLRVRHRAA